jgi:hypothetical protein
VTSGFLNLGIVLLLAAGLVVAVRRMDREDHDKPTGEAVRWRTIAAACSTLRRRSAELAGRLAHPGAHHRR